MSLTLRPLINEPAVSSAAWSATKLIVGFDHGLVRIYAKQDFVLEREIWLGHGPVVQLAVVPDTETMAAICDKKCSVHDLGTRRLLLNVDTRSAKFVVALSGALVVGSGYKLRILRLHHGKIAAVSVVDTVDRTKVRGLGCVRGPSGKPPPLGAGDDTDQVYAVIGTKLPKLWRVDLSGQGRLVPVMVLDPPTFARAHRFTLAGTAGCLVVGSSVGSLYLRMQNPLQVVSQMPAVAGVSVVESRPTGLTLLAVLTPTGLGNGPGPSSSPSHGPNESQNGRAIASAPELAVLNPATGSVLAREAAGPEVQLVGTGLALHRARLVELDVQVTVDMLVTGAIDQHEAAKLAFTLPAAEITDAVRDLERLEVAELFSNNHIDEAMRALLTIEEQEPESGPFVNNAFASELLLPYLENIPIDHEPTATTNGGARNSLFSVRTSLTARTARTTATMDAACVRYHPLNAAVAYLTYTRRKLRLRGVTDRDRLSGVDTALFLCYLVMRSPLLASLVRSPNFCDPAVVEPRLLEINKWRELVWFFKSQKMPPFHRKALDLLVQHKDPPTAIADYLASITDLDVVFEYSRPLLRESPDLARRLFYENMFSPSGDVSARIYSFLRIDVSPQAADDFALFRVQKAGDQTKTLHDRAAIILANNAAEDGSEMDVLLQFLQSSPVIDAATLVENKAMPVEGQAILYQKMGDYKRAIDLYLGIGQPRTAQQIAEGNDQTVYMFDRLSLSGSGSQMIEFLNSVSAHSDLRLDYVLSRLDASLPLNELTEFLTRFTVAGVERTQVVNSMEAVSRRSLAQKSIQIADEKRHRVTITNLDACTVCHKRLGRAVTTILNNEAMHYTCFKNRK